MFLTSFVAFKVELIQVGLLFLFGFLIEAMTTAEESHTLKNLGFNVSYTVIARFVDLGFGVAYASTFSRLVLNFHIPALITISPSRAILPALAGGALGLAIGDFFYYWFHRLQHFS